MAVVEEEWDWFRGSVGVVAVGGEDEEEEEEA